MKSSGIPLTVYARLTISEITHDGMLSGLRNNPHFIEVDATLGMLQ